MKITNCSLEGLLVLEPNVYEDNRGWFKEAYKASAYRQFRPFVQDNISFSRRGTLRGLHIQTPSQGKLIQVLSGAAFDVAVDLRANSPTFGRYDFVYLTPERQFWIPEGFAHGFLALEDTLLMYKCTQEYDPKGEKTLLWNDPDVGITWPLVNVVSKKFVGAPLISEKDNKGLPLKEFR